MATSTLVFADDDDDDDEISFEKGIEDCINWCKETQKIASELK